MLRTIRIRQVAIIAVTSTVLAGCESTGNTAQNEKTLRITWEENILGVRLPIDTIPTIEIWYLEAFCRSGSTDREWNKTVIPHRTRKVYADRASRLIQLESTVGESVTVVHEIRAGTDEVDFRLTLTNTGRDPVDIDWAQPCIRVGEFTGLGQNEYIRRCFLFTDDGLRTLDDLPRAVEARYRGGQVYVPTGIDLEDVNPRPISHITPKYDLIGCTSKDGQWLLATAWDHTQELFQGVIECIHADFRIGGLQPAETKELHGKLYLMRNDPDTLLARYRKDFP